MFKKLGLPTEKDFYRAFFAIAVPVVLQNLVNNSLVFIDTFMLSFLNESAIAAANLATLPFFVVMLMLFGFQSGSGMIISQYWGKRDVATINRVIGIAMMSCCVVTVAASSIMFILPAQIIGLINKDPEVVRLAAGYSRIVAFSFVLNAFTSIYITAQRNMEKPKIGLYVHSSAMIVNTALNYVLIFGKFGAPAMGVAGAAIATLISRFVEFGITAVYALFIAKNIKLDFKAMLRPGLDITRDFFRNATPVILNETIWGLGFSQFAVIFSLMNTSVMAAYTIAGNAERVIGMFNFGIALAAGVLVGKATGAGDFDRAYRYGKAVGIIAISQAVVMGVVLLLAAPAVLSVMNISGETKAVAHMMLVVFALLMPFRAFNVTNLVGTLRSGGDARFVMFVDVGVLWLVGLPLAYLTGIIFKLPPVFVMLAFVADDVFKFVASGIRLLSRKWMRNITRKY